MTENSSPERTDATDLLIASTVTSLKKSAGDRDQLTQAVSQFYSAAVSTGIELENIEDILGVNQGCIMDLAELSEEDEEIVIEAFEAISNA